MRVYNFATQRMVYRSGASLGSCRNWSLRTVTNLHNQICVYKILRLLVCKLNSEKARKTLSAKVVVVYFLKKLSLPKRAFLSFDGSRKFNQHLLDTKLKHFSGIKVNFWFWLTSNIKLCYQVRY